MSTTHHPWCIAHRGARNEAPDNTRSAFMRALNYPIDGIELDVQMSADGVPVLYHDQSLYRLGGGRKRIADLTFSQLQQLDWGGWFHPDFSREPLMTLDQVLPLLNRGPRLLIEIKSHPSEQASGHANRLTEKVISMVTQPQYSALQDRLFILSFDPKVLSMAHGLAPQLSMVLNLTGLEPPEAVWGINFLWAIDVQIGKLTEPLVKKARSRKLKIMSYTCNGPRQVAKAIRLGIDAIISDRPDWLTKYLGRKQLHDSG
jgi:glycerophosphoryl diester phosphodiesterase